MINAVYTKFINWYNALLKPKYWYVYTALFTFFVVLVLTAPTYFAFTKDFHVCSACVDFQAKINRADHLFKPSYYPDNYHMAKTQFRITVALIAKVTGIRSVVGMFIIQQFLGLVFLIVACLLAFRITGDRIIAATITLSLGFIYVGKAAFVDTVGFTDSFAFCFLAIALFSRNKLIIVLSLLLAFFTDERAIISSYLIGVYFFVEYLQLSDQKINWLVFAKSRLFILLISWLLCFTIRFILNKTYGLHTPSSGASGINMYAWSYIFWEGLKGFWLLVIGGCIYLIAKKRFFILLLVIAGLALQMIVTSMVSDVTRSIAYVFPVIFIAICFFEKGTTKPQLQKIVLIVCLVSFLSADSFYIVGDQPVFYRSLPVKIIDKVFNQDQKN